MTRSIATSIAATLLTTVLGTGVGQAAPPIHQASGGGTIEYAGALNTHAFTARIDAEGNVRGEAQFQSGYLDLTLHVEIDCLSVAGGDAWLGGTIRTSSDPALVGQQVTFRVQDNGEGAASPPDQTSQVVIGVIVPSCTTMPPLGLIPWTNGNVQVRSRMGAIQR